MLRRVEAVCPLLALAGDARSVVEGVDPTHRCQADEPPQPVDRHMQARTCLTAAHTRCERYLAHAARQRAATRSLGTIGDGLVVTRFALAPEPAWRGLAGRARTDRRAGLLAAVGVAVLLVGVGAAAALALGGPAAFGIGGPPDPLIAGGDATPSASTRAEPTGTPRPTALPSATRTPEPTATPTRTASASPTAAPTITPSVAPAATPPPAQTYVVQEGDTLGAIAQRFGTTVQAIQAANDIPDPNEILIGQVLVIP
jgi:LysM repeat protein